VSHDELFVIYESVSQAQHQLLYGLPVAIILALRMVLRVRACAARQ
jgi:hypothetical protein